MRDEGIMTYGTHTTPIHRYIDDIDFTFETQNDGSCFIKVIKIFFNILLRMQSNNKNLFRAIVNPKHFLCWILELIIAVSTSILGFQKKKTLCNTSSFPNISFG